jgi:hypothetical protein
MRVGKLCCNLDREYFSGTLEQESPDIPWAYQNSKAALLYIYHLEVHANPKNGTKKPKLFLASMGGMGLSHDIF